MYETIRATEYASLLPLATVSVIYWFRDKFRYNRASKGCEVTRAQRTVAFIYPLWAFLTWMRGLQTNRGDAVASFITTTGEYLTGYYSVLGILNDSFRITKQQALSFPMGLTIAYIWTLFSLVIFSPSDQVCNVVSHNQTGD